MIRAIIFDYFGVIRIDPVFIAYRQLGGDDEADRDFIERTLHASDKGQLPQAGPILAERLGVSEAEWEKASRHAEPFDEDILNYILDLRKFYKIGLLTNIGAGDLAKWFKPHALETYFDAAVASGDIGFAKPETQAYEIIAEKLGVRTDECIIIDDLEVNCEGARAAGMPALLYTSFDQLRDDIIGVLVAESEGQPGPGHPETER